MLAFIDESGHPHPTDTCKISALVAVCIKEIHVRELTNTLFSLKQNILGNSDREYKSTEFLNPSTLRNESLNKHKFVEELFAYIDTMTLGIFAIIIPRPTKNIKYEAGLLPRNYCHLLERINRYCQEQRHQGLIVYDNDANNKDKNLALAFNNYLFRHELGKQCTNIVESPFFVRSSITPGIQIADFVAGVIRHYFENVIASRDETEIKYKNAEYVSHIEKFFKIVQRKKKDYPQGISNLYGFFHMPLSHFIYNE